MEFNSIEEIKQHFGLEMDDLNDLKKNLKGRLKDVHSDKTGGEYKSAVQKREHEEISTALDFIDNCNKEIAISRIEWTSLQKQFEEIKKIKTENDLLKISEISQQLDKSLHTSVVQYQKDHFTVKLSSIIATTIISALWAFPFIAAKHPLLNVLVNEYKLIFTAIWITAICISGIVWLYTKRLESIDKSIKQNYNLDSTQNQIFKFFIAWLQIAYPRSVDYDFTNSKHNYVFSRDDLFNFILNHFNSLSKEFTDIVDYSIFDLYMELSKKYKSSKEILKVNKVKRLNFSKIWRCFFKVPGELDVNLAQKLTDSMLCKLIERDVIIKHGKQLFNDTYGYVEA